MFVYEVVSTKVLQVTLPAVPKALEAHNVYQATQHPPSRATPSCTWRSRIERNTIRSVEQNTNREQMQTEILEPNTSPNLSFDTMLSNQ